MRALQKMKALCVVPARGGSKGVARKNLRLVGGVPLVARAIRTALTTAFNGGLNMRVICSTDDREIADVAKRWGAEVPFMRPGHLATDGAKTIDALVHLLGALGDRFDAILVVQPTSPLFEPADLISALELFTLTRDPVISVARDSHPVSWSHILDDDGVLSRLGDFDLPHQRQAAETTYSPNGAVYCADPELLLKERSFFVEGRTRGLVMPKERSVDIDSELDLTIAEALLGAQPIEPILVGERLIGPGHPCFVIAEAGVNHNGEVALAKKLVDAAADAGADAVKFQTFKARSVVSETAPQAHYQEVNTGVRESQMKMVERLELGFDAHREILDHCRIRGIRFLSSPFDAESADFLVELGVEALKIGSGELTNHEFLKHVAGKGLPVIVSTGMADIVEVHEALVAMGKTEGIALLHCVSNYPADPADCNLAAVDTLARAFGVPTGWSDHTKGIHVAVGAAARGACIIEKHFTLDRAMPGPDHAASLEPPELRDLVNAIRIVEGAIGDGVKRPAPSEADTAEVARRSLHLSRHLPAGTVLCASDIIALRPGTGIPVARKWAFVGRRISVELFRGQMLREEDVE